MTTIPHGETASVDTDPDVAQRRSSPLDQATLGQRLWIVVAAAVPALLYFIYVFHYSSNVPYLDDWNMIPLVNSAIHGHLAMGALWSQYAGAARIVVGKLIFVAFGLMDHLDEKSITLCSAVIFIASYVLLLICFRSYLGRRLRFLPVLVIGMVWFSLIDVQNSLWSFQISWYLVAFFFVAAMYLLLVPHQHRMLYFALAIVAAVGASFSEIPGLVVWLVGVICLVWRSPWTRRTYYELAIWASAASLTLLMFFRGYSFAELGVLSPRVRLFTEIRATAPRKADQLLRRARRGHRSDS